MAANRDQRFGAAVAEAKPARRAQPEVEVVGERIAIVVAAYRFVHGAMDHAARVNQVVVDAEQSLYEWAARELAAPPHSGALAPAVDDHAIAVDHAGAGEPIEQRDLAPEPSR